MPSPVDKYYKQVKEKNPSYSDSQAWATAWSIYCKHKNPGSPSCHKPREEYLKRKEAAQPVLEFAEALMVKKVASRYMLAMALPDTLQDMLTAWRKRKDRLLDAAVEGLEDLDELIRDFKEIDDSVRDRNLRQLIRDDIQDIDSLLQLREDLGELGVVT